MVLTDAVMGLGSDHGPPGLGLALSLSLGMGLGMSLGMGLTYAVVGLGSDHGHLARLLHECGQATCAVRGQLFGFIRRKVAVDVVDGVRYRQQLGKRLFIVSRSP